MTDYCTVGDITAYLTDRLDIELWTSATDAQKEDATKQASRNVDNLSFKGRKYDVDQDLQWPRSIQRPNGAWTIKDWDTGTDAAVVPTFIKNAAAEEALALLDPALKERHDLQNSGVISYKLSDLRESYAPTLHARHGIRSSDAWAILRPWVGTTGRIV